VSVHIHDDDLQRYLLGRLPAERISAIDSHLTDCNGCGGRLVEAVRFLSRLAKANVYQSGSRHREKRRSPRFSAHEPISVQSINPFSSDSVEASLENVSRGGMQLRTATLLGAGTLIKLHLRSAVMFGEVRYCEGSGNDFFIGIQFSDAL
jgi:anti-sigma factor RsiW